MKKVFCLIVVFFCFWEIDFLFATESIFVFGPTDVEVEFAQGINEALQAIKENIKLKEGYEDPNFYVENNGVNYTFQSTINTNILKSYRLDHRAVSPKYNKKEIKTYYLHVVDKIPPVVISSTPFMMQYQGEKPDLIKGLLYKDNQTETDKIVVIIDERDIDYNKVGEYEVLYILIDESGNKTFHVERLKVVDLLKPKIEVINELKHQVDAVFNIEDYFLITDNYDLNPQIEYEFIGDVSLVGIVDLKVVATDSSGNSQVLDVELKIVDELPPTIVFGENIIIISTETMEIDYLSLIDFYDNYDKLTADNLTITHNILFGVVGIYEVVYRATDSSDNFYEATLTVYIKDILPPTIIATNHKFRINETVDLLTLASVSDNYSSLTNIEFSVLETNVDFTKQGRYFVTFLAVDEAGNHEYLTINIDVEGKTKNENIFYVLIGFGAILSIGVGVFYIIKKRKKTI